MHASIPPYADVRFFRIQLWLRTRHWLPTFNTNTKNPTGKYIKGFTDERSESTEKMTLRSHNDYVMQLTAANVQRRKYFDLDLPELLDSMQELHVNILNDASSLVQDAAAIASEGFGKLAELQTAVAESGKQLNGNHDVSIWLAISGQSGGEVVGADEIEYSAPQTAAGKEAGYERSAWILISFILTSRRHLVGCPHQCLRLWWPCPSFFWSCLLTCAHSDDSENNAQVR